MPTLISSVETGVDGCKKLLDATSESQSLFRSDTFRNVAAITHRIQPLVLQFSLLPSTKMFDWLACEKRSKSSRPAIEEVRQPDSSCAVSAAPVKRTYMYCRYLSTFGYRHLYTYDITLTTSHSDILVVVCSRRHFNYCPRHTYVLRNT